MSWLAPLQVAASDGRLAVPAVLLLACAATAGLVWGRKRLSGTTLVSAWWWALLAVWFLVAVESLRLWPAAISEGTFSALRYAAAAATFCPMMAALGAKRPQDKAWQFVVLSLWVVLVLPAAESVFLRTGRPLAIEGARSWFLLGLIVVGAANSLPTRFWPAALLAAAGQTLLLLDYLPFGIAPRGDASILAGMALSAAAILLAAGLPRRRPANEPLDRLWLDFRDLFGALWGLRVAERVNTAAALYNWQIVLSWRGFRQTSAARGGIELSAEQAAAVRRNLDNLLRRFVSPEWIDARLGDGALSRELESE